MRLLSADSKLHLVSLSFTVILNGIALFIRAKDTVYQRYKRDHLAFTISRVSVGVERGVRGILPPVGRV